MNILRAMAIIALVGTAPVQAGEAVLHATSSVTGGWTSNAQGRADGTDAYFIVHGHEIGLSGGGAGIGLRGAMGLEQTRYPGLPAENDWQGTAGLEAEAAMGPNARLRGSIALLYAEDGTALDTPGGLLGAVSPRIEGGVSLRHEAILENTTLGFHAAYDAVRPGLTRVEAALLAPQRIRARTDMLTAGVDLAHTLSPRAAMQAQIRWQGVHVDEDDQTRFGRFPLDVGRLASGIEIGDGQGTGIVLRGGIDALLPRLPGASHAILPHAEAEARLAIGPALALRAGFSAGVDIEAPADGLADWRLAARGGVVWSPLEGTEIETALFAGEVRSVGFDIGVESEWGGEIRARRKFAALLLDAGLVYRRVSGLAPAYDETRISLGVSASI